MYHGFLHRGEGPLRSRSSAYLNNLLALALLGVLVTLSQSIAGAQGETTSAILGEVTDSTGAVVPGAMVTVVNRDTGLKRSAATDAGGRFNFPQLKPGTYTVKAEAQGFEPQEADNVFSALGQKQAVNLTLRVAQSRQVVEVNGDAAIINPGNANTSTTLNDSALENLPNPGGDMTYPLQFAPGALINTAGSSNDFVGGTNGYGNVEFNGLPALSNGYIVDGLETNDPLTNLNSGLATNLVLGLNSISEVTVNTLSYSVDQGRYGASQVNYVTKSGTNRFHGNLYELWNGSLLNASDYFTNTTSGGHQPRSTVNHFGGSIGGPIVHDRLFFFFDSEWVRIALPIFNTMTVPSAALQQYVLQRLPLGGTDSVTGSHYAAAPRLVPFYQRMFSLYGNTGGTPLSVLGCPFNTDGSAAPGNPSNGNGCANRTGVSHSSDDREQVQTGRLDYNIGRNDSAWVRFQADTGLQAAYTDPINPLFNAISSQPLYSFAAGYTHVFSQNLVNYFNPAFSWYESLFAPGDFQNTLAAFPIVLQGSGANAPFTTIGGLDNTWVQGRRASRFFINDNLAWSHGPHEFRFGTNDRIFRLNDFDFGEGTVPTVTYTTLPQFIYGVASTATQTFPTSANEPFNLLNLDFYAQDTWRVTPKVTWTIGVRDTFNSNPLNPHDHVARLSGAFDSVSHDVNQPLSDAIQTGLGTCLPLRRWPYGSHGRPSPCRYARTPLCAPASDCSVTFCRAAWPTSSERTLLLSGRFKEVCSELPAGRRSRQGCPTARSTQLSRPISGSLRVLPKASSRAHLPQPIRRPVFRRWRSPPFPTANYTRHTLCNGVSELRTKLGLPPALRYSMWALERSTSLISRR
jgi:hypothetical protein